jgi:hypothetical protein
VNIRRFGRVPPSISSRFRCNVPWAGWQQLQVYTDVHTAKLLFLRDGMLCLRPDAEQLTVRILLVGPGNTQGVLSTRRQPNKNLLERRNCVDEDSGMGNALVIVQSLNTTSGGMHVAMQLPKASQLLCRLRYSFSEWKTNSLERCWI